MLNELKSFACVCKCMLGFRSFDIQSRSIDHSVENYSMFGFNEKKRKDDWNRLKEKKKGRELIKRLCFELSVE